MKRIFDTIHKLNKARRKEPIEAILNHGADNPITGERLARYFNVDLRTITKEIKREREKGIPINASKGDNPGYYLCKDREENEAYLARIRAEISSLQRTHDSVEAYFKDREIEKAHQEIEG